MKSESFSNNEMQWSAGQNGDATEAVERLGRSIQLSGI
jgi:hypothetical protein